MNRNVRLTWDFVKDIVHSQDVESIKATLRSLASTYGLTSAFGGIIPKDLHGEGDLSKLVLVADIPLDWAARYMKRGYVHRDPIIKFSPRNARYYSWDDAYRACVVQEDVKIIEGEAAEFGMREGFVVPVQMLDENKAIISYGGANIDISPAEKDALAFATNFAVGQLIFHTWRPKGPPATLTAREVDCLLWAAEGKTDWEISVIFNISRSTVEKHMLSARTKLGAMNKHHAIAQAMRSRILR